MAERFNLTADLKVAGPDNLDKVVGKIVKRFKSFSAPINIKLTGASTSRVDKFSKALKLLNKTLKVTSIRSKEAEKSIRKFTNSLSRAATASRSIKVAKITTDLRQVSKAAKVAGNSIESFGARSGLAFKRFLAFSIPAGFAFGLVSAFKDGVTAALEFEVQMVKIAQVAGVSVSSLGALEKTIRSLAISTGVEAVELAKISKTLKQTGINAGEVKTLLEGIAQTSLAPTFGTIQETTEGAIAIMRQFGLTAEETVGKLSAVNAVASKFAVESEGITTAVRKAGGVFAITGGTFEEFISLFTSIRATTRESNDVIATGLRTLTTRLQKLNNVRALEGLGISLRDAEGEFVGVFESVERINKGLANTSKQGEVFASVVEKLGGLRQARNFIPLIEQIEVARQALSVAQAPEDIGDVTAKALTTTQNKIKRLRNEFSDLFIEIGQSQGFKDLANQAIEFARASVKIADALKPLLPLLTALIGIQVALKAGQFARNFGGSFFGGGRAAGAAGAAGAVGGGGLLGRFIPKRRVVSATALGDKRQRQFEIGQRQLTKGIGRVGAQRGLAFGSPAFLNPRLVQQGLTDELKVATQQFKDIGLSGRRLQIAQRKYISEINKGASSQNAITSAQRRALNAGGFGVGPGVGTRIRRGAGNLVGAAGRGLARNAAGVGVGIGAAGVLGAEFIDASDVAGQLKKSAIQSIFAGIGTGAFAGGAIGGAPGAVVGAVVGGFAGAAAIPGQTEEARQQQTQRAINNLQKDEIDAAKRTVQLKEEINKRIAAGASLESIEFFIKANAAELGRGGARAEEFSTRRRAEAINRAARRVNADQPFGGDRSAIQRRTDRERSARIEGEILAETRAAGISELVPESKASIIARDNIIALNESLKDLANRTTDLRIEIDGFLNNLAISVEQTRRTLRPEPGGRIRSLLTGFGSEEARSNVDAARGIISSLGGTRLAQRLEQAEDLKRRIGPRFAEIGRLDDNVQKKGLALDFIKQAGGDLGELIAGAIDAQPDIDFSLEQTRQRVDTSVEEARKQFEQSLISVADTLKLFVDREKENLSQLKAINQERNSLENIKQKALLATAKFEKREVTLKERNAGFLRKQQNLLGGRGFITGQGQFTNPSHILTNIEESIKARGRIIGQLEKETDAPRRTELFKQLEGVNSDIDAFQKGLRNLANNTNKLAQAQADLARLEQQKSIRQQAARGFLGQGLLGRVTAARNIASFTGAAARGTLEGTSIDEQQRILSGARSLGEGRKLEGFGGKTVREILDELIKNSRGAGGQLGFAAALGDTSKIDPAIKTAGELAAQGFRDQTEAQDKLIKSMELLNKAFGDITDKAFKESILGGGEGGVGISPGISAFNESSKLLSEELHKFPRTIEMKVQDINVNVLGVEGLAGINNQVSELIAAKIEEGLGKITEGLREGNV